MKIIGEVVHGEGRGRTMGFPTLNIGVQPMELPFGVYVCTVTVEQKKYLAVMNWGGRPTFDALNPVLEAFLLDADGDFYGRDVELEVGPRLRGVQRFVSVEALQQQIAEDVRRARDYFQSGAA